MDGGVLFDVGNFLRTLGLDRSKKDKSGLYVEDLDLILHYLYVRDGFVYTHERLRVQLALILIIAGATATRPNALIGNVLYKHVEFQLFPPSPGGTRPRLGLEFSLVNVKKSAGSSKILVFGFHEEHTLLHDPVLHMLALAFADGAFLNEFSSPEQIYEIEVPSHVDRVRIPWKAKWQDRAIFRSIEGLEVSASKALKYGRTRDDLVRLGRALGYAKILQFYDIRRGSGKKLNGEYYMTDLIGNDTQAIIFGGDPQTDFVNMMGRLERHGLAPTELTEEQKQEVRDSPELLECRQKISEALVLLKKQGYRSYVAAKKAGKGQDYEKHKKRLDSLRKKLESQRLKEEIAAFHKTIHGKEIAQQLNGMKPTKDALAPSTDEYELEERTEVVGLFSQAPYVTTHEELFQCRLKLVSALARLCNRRESP
ncbi:hypothetical protein B0I35DRAFT_328326, partial [Stachybotrys elegans]